MRGCSLNGIILCLVFSDLTWITLATAPDPPVWNAPEVKSFTFEYTDMSGCEEVTILSATPLYGKPVSFKVISEGPEGGFGTETIDNTSAKLTCDQARIGDGKTYNVHVRATEINEAIFSDILLVIKASKVSAADKQPVFSKPNPDPASNDNAISILETVKGGDTVYWLSAADPDTATARLTYSMDNSDITTKELFELKGNKLSVKADIAKGTFDYDKDGAVLQYPILLRVSDGVFSSSLDTNINVHDVNDNAPVFETIQTHNIHETITAGSVLFTTSATDGDRGLDNSKIKYSLSGTTHFDIDPDTGVVTLAIGTFLNRTEVPKYSFTIVATDGGSPAMSSSLDVTLNILRDGCKMITDDYGTWPTTKIGQTAYIECQDFNEGNISRVCDSVGIWGAVSSQCEITDDVFKDLKQQLDLLSSSPNDVSKDIEDISKNLSEITNIKADRNVIENVIGLSQDIVGIVENTLSVTNNGTEYFLQTMSNLIKPDNEEAWNKTDVQGSAVLEVVDRYVAVLQEVQCNDFNDGEVKEIEKDHLYTEIGRKTGSLTFPNTKQIGSVISIPEDTFKNKGVLDVCFGGSVYNSVGIIIEKQVENGGTGTGFSKGQEVNSDVISIQLQQKGGVTYDNLNPPILVTLTLLNENLTNPVCVFWDYNMTNEYGGQGAWSPTGCRLFTITNSTATCECTHLTNFAILMSPSNISDKHSKILGIISAIGCAISMVCLILTIVAHSSVWRVVRSNRTVTLMNLCVALLIALAIFLAGVNRTESPEACAAIAALIQYFFLTVFFLMLLIGIEILLSVIQVFGPKFPVTNLLPLAWCAPAVIVGISVGVTKTEGYGNDFFCWLDIDAGLIWSFIGPVLLVILVNTIIVIVVFKKMASSRVMKTKTSAMRIKTSLRSLCVLLPVMGLTWLLGILSVNSDLFILQYLFCIFNTLQGLLIFLFHCVFNRQMREALRLKKGRRKTMETFTSEVKNTKAEKSLTFEKDQNASNSDGFDNNAYISSNRRNEERLTQQNRDKRLK